jgi:hypothetical protein
LCKIKIFTEGSKETVKTGKNLQEMAAELDRQRKSKKDYLVGTRAIEMSMPAGALTLRMLGDNGTHGEPLSINHIAHSQIGQYAGIPAKYYEKMRSELPELLAYNVNEWFGHQPSTRMLRTLDGSVRAFLSERYRRIDNYEIAETALPIIGAIGGASVRSCELTESRMYIKVVTPRITAEVTRGDIVQAGVVISNSEVGVGSVQVSPLIYRLVCTNGMIAADSAIRKYHIGRTDDNIDVYSDRTIAADNGVFLMKLKDTVSAAVDQARFTALVGKLREATEAKIEAAVVPKAVELTAKEYGITRTESSGVLGHLIAGGDLSLYGLANAVTRQSQDETSYDRATEMEIIGYRIATMPGQLWRQIQTA